MAICLDYQTLKVHMTRNFLLAYSKEVSKCLFYCDSTFGCQVIQDFGLCK